MSKGRHRSQRKRAGITPVIATLMIIAVTIVAGGAVFFYVNSQAAIQEQRLGEANSSYLNFLNERFVTVNANFSSNKVTIWFYNNGNLTTKIQQIWIWNTTRSLYVAYNSSGVFSGSSSYPVSLESPVLPISLPSGSTQKITLTLPGTLTFNAGRTYYIHAVAQYGNTYTYFQVK